jgi:DNA sulfur modification protein DndD
LNGASKRALTLSFIWALTEVSGVIAPRVIDTPLGMMSGGVKRRVVEIISNPDLVSLTGDQNGAGQNRQELQVVLFLTRQEILMVEDLLDARAGKITTLTNSASYPVDLLNDPQVEHPMIRVCECNHRQHCPICARKDDNQHSLVERPLPR